MEPRSNDPVRSPAYFTKARQAFSSLISSADQSSTDEITVKSSLCDMHHHAAQPKQNLMKTSLEEEFLVMASECQSACEPHTPPKPRVVSELKISFEPLLPDEAPSASAPAPAPAPLRQRSVDDFLLVLSPDIECPPPPLSSLAPPPPDVELDGFAVLEDPIGQDYASDFAMVLTPQRPDMLFCDIHQHQVIDVEPPEEDTDEWDLMPASHSKDTFSGASSPEGSHTHSLSDSALFARLNGFTKKFNCAKADCTDIVMKGVKCEGCLQLFCSAHAQAIALVGLLCGYCAHMRSQTLGPTRSHTEHFEKRRRVEYLQRKALLGAHLEKMRPQLEGLYNITSSNFGTRSFHSVAALDLNVFRKLTLTAKATWETCHSCRQYFERLGWQYNCELCGACVCAKCISAMSFRSTFVPCGFGDDIEMKANACPACAQVIYFYIRRQQFSLLTSL